MLPIHAPAGARGQADYTPTGDKRALSALPVGQGNASRRSCFDILTSASECSNQLVPSDDMTKAKSNLLN